MATAGERFGGNAALSGSAPMEEPLAAWRGRPSRSMEAAEVLAVAGSWRRRWSALRRHPTRVARGTTSRHRQRMELRALRYDHGFGRPRSRPGAPPTTEVVMSNTVETAIDIRPFHVNIPDEALDDLRRRIAATNWPERETVADQSQGVPLAMIQKLARYWMTDYDWRTCEANLNALPQFITEIDGLDIHFIHVRSQHEDALPLIVNHGWPGSIIEQLKIIDRLADPTAHGGDAADAFHMVIPSMPGYGFSGKPTSTGWGPERMGQ